jgi:ATP synthase protein I
MTTETRASTPLAPLVRAAVLPGLVAGIVVALVALMVEGAAGLWGALAGAVLVTAFFGSGQLVLRAFKQIEPMFLMAIALMTYALQVVVLIVLYAVFANSDVSEDQFSTKAFGVAVLVSTAVWIVALIRAAKRERIPLYELEGSQR